MRALFGHLVRDGTRAGHVRGLKDFLSYARRIGVRHPLPSSSDVVLGYIAYSLMERGFILDAATVDIYLGGVRAWHEQAKFETGGAVVNTVATTAVRTALRIALYGVMTPLGERQPCDEVHVHLLPPAHSERGVMQL